MAKDINLLSYWMPLLRQLKEFKEIANTEEPELRYLLEAIDRTISNMYIESADEVGIKRFESLVGIYPDEGATLDTRKFNVLIKWNDKVPYTDNELYNRLVSLCGSADKFTITEKYKDYTIDISTQLGVDGAFDAVATLLKDMLPCNMVLNLKNTLEAIKTNYLYMGVVTCTAMAYQITNDINKEYKGSGDMYYGVGLSKAGTHIITHDVELEDTLVGNLRGAVGFGYATTQLITHDLESKVNVTGNSTVANPVNTATVITLN